MFNIYIYIYVWIFENGVKELSSRLKRGFCFFFLFFVFFLSFSPKTISKGDDIKIKRMVSILHQFVFLR